jgi:hypothetical protein
LKRTTWTAGVGQMEGRGSSNFVHDQLFSRAWVGPDNTMEPYSNFKIASGCDDQVQSKSEHQEYKSVNKWSYIVVYCGHWSMGRWGDDLLVRTYHCTSTSKSFFFFEVHQQILKAVLGLDARLLSRNHETQTRARARAALFIKNLIRIWRSSLKS